tara:strand:+ start:66 stop:383 length:318 start_codon:yes stop_codon:yes gene_type:complete
VHTEERDFMIRRVRQTSRNAYNELSSTGRLGTQKERILNAMQPGVNYSLRELMIDVGLEINAISGRVNTLKKEGKLKEANKRKCEVSGKLINPVYKVITVEENTN